MHSLLSDATTLPECEKSAPKRLVIRLKNHDLEPIEAIAWFGSRVILL